MRISRRVIAVGVLVAVLPVVASCGTDHNAAAHGELVGPAAQHVVCGGQAVINASGSTAQANAMTRFVDAFELACPKQTLDYTPNGSGAGIREFIGKQTDFAGSDSLLSTQENADARKRCGGAPTWSLPVVFGPIAVTFNLPGISSLNLDGPTLAKIFDGAITSWNDPAIAALNTGLRLPATPVRVIFRSDHSGTTEHFQKYLETASDGVWTKGAFRDFKGGVGEGIRGNYGTAAAVADTEGSITYSEWSFAQARGLATAAIITSAGPTPVPISTAAAAQTIAGFSIPREGNDLVLDATPFYKPAKAGSYPIVMATYEIVCSRYPDTRIGSAVKAFLEVAVEAGQSQLAADGSVPVPEPLKARLIKAVVAVS